MTGALKALIKRYWPRLRLRTILLATLLFVAALPGVGALFLRVYENTLVRQTESELIAQGAALAAAAEAAWPGSALPAARRLRPDEYRPEPPQIDLNGTPILPERPAPARGPAPDPAAVAAAGRIAPVMMRTAQTTLASIQLLDRRGTIVTGPLAGAGYGDLPEVAGALAGRPTTVLRHNGSYRPEYPLEWLSRASDLRIHHVRPVSAGGRVVGALLLSRSPRALFRGLYEDRGKILFGIAAIFATLVLLSGLLSRGISRPIERLSGATRRLALGGGGEVPEPPQTAAVEIQALYRDFADMAEAIERRSRYLRDFAHAVSHEFKTPLAGIRGGIELLQDHQASMAEAERERFLANVAADAERLAQLVSRLLQLARADMARPDPDALTAPAALRSLVDAAGQRGIAVRAELPEDLPALAVPSGTVEAALASLADNALQAGATAIEIVARADAQALVMEISDDGPGIPPSDRERIFEPFFTSRRSAGGTGLGLPIVRSLLEASRATIELAPSDAGARFRIRLPLA
jgi:signal transduction histidine kinase